MEKIMPSNLTKPSSIENQLDRDAFSSAIVTKNLRHLGFILEEEQVPFGQKGLNPRVDFIFRREGEKYAVEVKYSRRIQLVFMHLLPRAILLLQAVRRISGFIPIVAIVVEKLSEMDIQRMANHMGFYAPEVGWALIDRNENIVFKDPAKDQYNIVKSGNIEWQGKELPGGVSFSRKFNELFRSNNYAEIAEIPTPYIPQQLSFSDSEQWLLKLLLLASKDIKPHQWGGPIGNVANAFQLSKLAGVSPPIANSFVNAMESSGYLKRVGRKKLILLSPRTLIEEWRGKYRFYDNQVFPYRSIYPISESDVFFEEILGDIKKCNREFEPLAITGHQACKLYKVKHSSAKSIHIYFWGDRQNIANALNLVPAEVPDDADLFLAEPKYPRSVFGGRIEKEGIPICDILQCYLDLFHFPDRGREQANFIYETIISRILIERKDGLI